LRFIRATFCFFAAFVPKSPGPPGLIYWEAVCSHAKPADYSATLIRTKPDKLFDAIAQHVYVLAEISKKKYYFVDCCLRLAFVGTGAALIVALFGQ
jgi:hypothetical protein